MLHLLIHFAYESLWRHGGPPRPHGSQTSRSQHREHLAPVSSLGASKSPDLGPLGPAWRQKQNWKSSESEIPEVFRKERLNLISKLSNWLATRQHSAAVEFPAISGPESLQNTQVWVWVNSGWWDQRDLQLDPMGFLEGPTENLSFSSTQRCGLHWICVLTWI